MSASSFCVTCGTFSHERCRNGPDTFLIRDSSLVSTGPNLPKSCAGISGIPEPCATAAAAGWAGPCRKDSRSSLVMRPFGPVAVTADRSTPSSRAIRRTEGPACAPGGAAPVRRGADRGRRRDRRGHRGGHLRGLGRSGLLLLNQRRRRRDRSVARRQVQDRRALADAVAHLDQHFGDRARARHRNVHRGLVGLQRDHRVFGVELVARRDVHLDHRHVLEIADVRDGDLDAVGGCRHLSSIPSQACAGLGLVVSTP